jgi:hypothetical protein
MLGHGQDPSMAVQPHVVPKCLHGQGPVMAVQLWLYSHMHFPYSAMACIACHGMVQSTWHDSQHRLSPAPCFSF